MLTTVNTKSFETLGLGTGRSALLVPVQAGSPSCAALPGAASKVETATYVRLIH